MKGSHLAITGVIMFAIVAVAVCAVAAFVFVPSLAVGSPTKNRDHFEILQLKYENAAVIALNSEWNKMYSRSFTFQAYRDPRGLVQPVFDQANLTSDMLELKIVYREKNFAADHGIASREWGNSFKKSFPERDVIFDEIALAIRPMAAQQILDSSRQVFDHRNDQGYCDNYFRVNAPKFVDQARAEALGLQSIKSLRAKVFK